MLKYSALELLNDSYSVTGFHKKVGYNTYGDSRPKGGKTSKLNNEWKLTFN